MDCNGFRRRLRDSDDYPAEVVTGHVRNLVLSILHHLCERGGREGLKIPPGW